MRHRAARLICRAAEHLLPAGSKHWAGAIAAESAAIDDDGEALVFAASSLCGLIRAAVTKQLLRAAGAASNEKDGFGMESGGPRSRAIGIACGAGAVFLGLAYMAAAGAPSHYLLLNAAALAIGLTLMAMATSLRGRLAPWSGTFVLACGMALLATSLFGDRAEGAARWVTVGSVFVQPSLVLLPAAILTFARTPGLLATCGMLAAALATALQPDRAMAATLFVGTSSLLIMRPGKEAMTAFIAATLALAVTLGRADRLPAATYVDQILYSAFDVHPLAGAAVLAGSALMVVPGLIGWLGSGEERVHHAVFGTMWSAVIAAAALGNYPTPLVGYGGSAIIGYLLSVAVLPRHAGRRAATGVEPTQSRAPGADRHLRTAAQAG